MDEIYIKVRLDGMRFAVPADDVLKILPKPVAVSVPGAPEGICGIVYDEGAVFPIFSVNPARHDPAQLAVLCVRGAGYAAYAADRAETMEALDHTELESAVFFKDTGILLLPDKEGTA